jgi:hypothetical protein
MAKDASTNGDSDDLSEKLEEVIRLLGLDGTGLTRSWDDFTGTTNRHVVRQAFQTISAAARAGLTISFYAPWIADTRAISRRGQSGLLIHWAAFSLRQAYVCRAAAVLRRPGCRIDCY